MQKILNDPRAFVDEMLEGILLAHPDQLRVIDGARAVVRAAPPTPICSRRSVGMQTIVCIVPEPVV